MADRVGFEPTLGFRPKHTFQACAFNHSATHPLEQKSLYITFFAFASKKLFFSSFFQFFLLPFIRKDFFMSLYTPPEFIQKRIIQSVQNDKQELLKYLLFNYNSDDKSEMLIKTKLLSLITNEPNCFNIPLITGSVWLTDDKHHQILMTHTKQGWNIPQHISNSDADLEAVISDTLKQNFNISAVSKGIFDLDYTEDDKTYEICFLMRTSFPTEIPLKNCRLMTENDLNRISFNQSVTMMRRLNKWKSISKERK